MTAHQKAIRREKKLNGVAPVRTFRPEEMPHLYETLRTGRMGKKYKLDKERKFNKKEG